MKIYFFLLGSKNATTSYSNTLFALGLQNLGYEVEIVRDLERKKCILKNPDCEAIVFQKTIQCPAHTSRYIGHLKGKVHLIHIDDDFQDMHLNEHVKTLKMTDLILVGTNQHKKALKDYTQVPVETISCVLDTEHYPYVPIQQKNNQRLIISWQQSCADAYTKDLLSIAEPLHHIIEKYPVDLHLYGWHMGKDYPDHRKEILDVFPEATFVAYEPMDQYIQHIVPRLSQSDLFLMPYIDIPHRWGKSGFGLKRVMLMGIPIIASNMEHHRELITPEQTGFLASNHQEWYHAMEKLVLSHALRQHIAINARKHMETAYNEEAVLRRFIDAIKAHIPIF